MEQENTISGSKPGSKGLRLLSVLIVTVVLLYFLLKNIEFNYLVNTFKNVTIYVFVIAFVFYLLTALMRAARFYFIFRKDHGDIKLRKFFSIVCIHTFFNSVLPLRLGELSYVYLLKKQSVKGTKAFFTLGVVRLFDLIAIFLFFSVALLFTTLANPLFNVFFLVFFIILLFIIVMIIFFRKWIYGIMQRINKSIKVRFISKILSKIIETLEHFGMIKSRKTIINLFVMSMLLWFFALMSNYVIVSHFIDIPFGVLIIGSCFAMLTYVLPIQGFMGFGTTEGAWSIVLLYFGFSANEAIATGFVMHILALAYAAILAGYGYLVRKK